MAENQLPDGVETVHMCFAGCHCILASKSKFENGCFQYFLGNRQ